jgi:ubiquinone/menaquinone biosynthesis C-methylase UbiE
MQEQLTAVESHYCRDGIFESILAALQTMGLEPDAVTARDLAAVDEFHVGGRDATIELSDRLALKPGTRVLDVGCGLGGSARFLAAERHCRVTGVDLTAEYIDVAKRLAQLLNLEELTDFRQCSALALAFPDHSFDVVWTEAAQMNIADKQGFYSEIARVLSPTGRFAFHDIFQGDGGELHYPVPWANENSISFLTTPDALRGILRELQFNVLAWEDKSQHALKWLASAVTASKIATPVPLGLRLLMGETAEAKLQNNIRNLAERRFVVVQGVAEKRPSGRSHNTG